jgi:hypothetical protein
VALAANTGPAASERSAKAAIMVFIFDVHRLTGKPSARAEHAGPTMVTMGYCRTQVVKRI